jgi:hypothetical protein
MNTYFDYSRVRKIERALIIVLLASVFGLSYSLWICMAQRELRAMTQAPNTSATSKAPDPSFSAAVVPTSPPATIPQLDLGSIKRLMATCDEEAAKDPDGLHFLVIPLVPATFEAATFLLPAGENYAGFVLISSADAINGLESGALAPSGRSYGFLVRDARTKQEKQLGSAAGPFRFTEPNRPALLNFQIGLSLPSMVVQWSTEYPRTKGSCYWVNVRFRS